jgi:hypothetical protein
VFLSPQKPAVNTPRLPRNSPRSHHQFTIKKHHFFENTPQKRPQNHEKPLTYFSKKFATKNHGLIEPDWKPIE